MLSVRLTIDHLNAIWMLCYTCSLFFFHDDFGRSISLELFTKRSVTKQPSYLCTQGREKWTVLPFARAPLSPMFWLWFRVPSCPFGSIIASNTHREKKRKKKKSFCTYPIKGTSPAITPRVFSVCLFEVRLDVFPLLVSIFFPMKNSITGRSCCCTATATASWITL